MAATTLTLMIEEAKAAEYIEAICNEAGLEVSAANARKVLKQLLEDFIAAHRRRTASFPVSGIT